MSRLPRITFDRSGVVAIFPERALAPLALIVFLRRAPGDELHALRDDAFAAVLHQEMDMIGRHHKIEHA